MTNLTLTSYNPATGEIVWQGPVASEKEMQSAILAARQAFSEWQFTPFDKRVSHLESFREALASMEDEVAEMISKEIGKPLWESKEEIKSVLNKVALSIESYRERCPEKIQDHPLGQAILNHKPHGVVAVLGPFNFPVHIPYGHIIPALLAGNTVIFKPSEFTPRTAELVMKAWEKSGIPLGVIQMIQGGREAGRVITSHAEVDGIFFTGNWETGIAFSEYVVKNPGKILALEMGGNNPLVISNNIANIEAAVHTTVLSAYLTSGQRCSCARRLIILEGVQGDAFLQALVEAVKAIHVGPYTENPEPFMGPVISPAAAAHLLTVQEMLQKRGGISLVEMHLMQVDTSLISPGLIDVTTMNAHFDEEVFGPLLRVTRVKNLEEAITEANNTTFGLTAGILSDKAEEYEMFYRAIKAGIINWNTPLTNASSALPFGGIKKSGNYRPSAYYAADYCSYPVASIISPQVRTCLHHGVKTGS